VFSTVEEIRAGDNEVVEHGKGQLVGIVDVNAGRFQELPNIQAVGEQRLMILAIWRGSLPIAS